MTSFVRRLFATTQCAVVLLLAAGCQLAGESTQECLSPQTTERSPSAGQTAVVRLPPAQETVFDIDMASAAAPRPVCRANLVTGTETGADVNPGRGAIRLVQGQESQPAGLPSSEQIPALRPSPPSMGLTLPKNLPGADAPRLSMPPDASPDERSAIVDRLFPKLPQLPSPVQFGPGPKGRALSLDDLLAIARDNSPLLRQARADIVAARGKAVDVGAYPNPQLGFEMDTVGTLGTAGYQGGLWNQTFKTAGKLGLARSAAMMDVRNAGLALRKANVELATSVQAGYFAVLVAQEWVRVSQALVQFTDEVYRVQVDQLRGGEAAAYEPAQLRAISMQARAAAVQARNRHISAWMQLAATLGVPAMPPTALAGRADIPIPEVSYDAALARVVSSHTDILSARNNMVKARFNLRFEQVKPIPDLNTYLAVQKDFTGPPFGTTVNVQAFLPVPILYRNQGGILDAQGRLMRATQDVDQVRNNLVARLAGTFERYENARTILEYYRDHILPDQARAYRGVYERHQQEPAVVAFNDIVTTQQTLTASVLQYVGLLADQWTAVTDLAKIVQVESLAELDELQPIEPKAMNRDK
jgi:outer membrane protein, heavy metal efflux system